MPHALAVPLVVELPVEVDPLDPAFGQLCVGAVVDCEPDVVDWDAVFVVDVPLVTANTGVNDMIPAIVAIARSVSAGMLFLLNLNSNFLFHLHLTKRESRSYPISENLPRLLENRPRMSRGLCRPYRGKENSAKSELGAFVFFLR
jgi:hypothetical protein